MGLKGWSGKSQNQTRWWGVAAQWLKTMAKKLTLKLPCGDVVLAHETYITKAHVYDALQFFKIITLI